MSNISNVTLNYFNIRYVPRIKWIGQTGNYKGFVKFDSGVYSVRAFLILLYNYRVKYNIHTIQSFVERFAPASDNNDVSSYVCYLTTLCNFDSLPNNYKSLCLFVQHIIRFETGVVFTDFTVRSYLLDDICHKALSKYLRYVKRFNTDFTSLS